MRPLSVLLILAAFAFADSITLRDGRTVSGTYLGGDSRSVRMAVGDHVDTFQVGEISTINFGGPAASTSAPAPPPPFREERKEERREERREERAAQAAPIVDRPQLPSGTVLTIRMIDSVDSERDRVGDTFRASLDEPVLDANGNTLVGRGADVVVKLVDDQQSGKIEGRTILTMDLVSLVVNGRTVDIDTQSITEQSGSRTARSAKVIGGTAALGAIIGAIAGGGKGAAIGAGAGAGVGTAAQVATKGQRVRIPSETRLTFTLQQPVKL
jgi:hypothetical protein